jgi:hypothetical protein
VPRGLHGNGSGTGHGQEVESDMTNEGDGLDERLRFIEELVDEQATVAGDVLEIDDQTWAIHGSIAMDGDVIMAEFTREEDAVEALAALRRDRGLGGSTAH